MNRGPKPQNLACEHLDSATRYGCKCSENSWITRHVRRKIPFYTEKSSAQVDNLGFGWELEVLVVADENDGAAGVFAQQGGVEFALGGIVEVGVGFVEQQQLRLADECACQERTLPLSAAQVADGAVGQGLESERAKGGLGEFAVVLIVMLPPFQRALESRAHGVEDGEGKFAVDGAILREVSHGESLAAPHLSLHRREQPGQNFEQSCFSSSVAATQHEHLPFVHFERAVVEYGSSPVAGGNVSESDERWSHGQERVGPAHGQ